VKAPRRSAVDAIFFPRLAGRRAADKPSGAAGESFKFKF